MNPLPHVVAAAIILAAGCATPQHRADDSAGANMPSTLAPSSLLAAESPMPGTTVIQSADFSLKAAQQGYRTEVRNGAVLYCWVETPVGSKIPTSSCLNEAQLRSRLEQEERQREQMQVSPPAACPLHMVCN